MGASATTPQLKLSPYTDEDSGDIVMIDDHAYYAQSDGEVCAEVQPSGAGIQLYGYVGLTDDPFGAGDNIAANCSMSSTLHIDVSFSVAKGEYFEIRTNSTNTPKIWWKSWGALNKPVDFG